jgi:hypothetical protein
MMELLDEARLVDLAGGETPDLNAGFASRLVRSIDVRRDRAAPFLAVTSNTSNADPKQNQRTALRGTKVSALIQLNRNAPC